MEESFKNKQHRRRKRKSDKVAFTGAEQSSCIRRTNESTNCQVTPSTSCPGKLNSFDEETSPGIEIQNCSQFIEHEPTVVWGTPQTSPNSGYEQNERLIDLITPPQEKCFSKKKPTAISKPVRKLMGESPSPSFLTKLMGLTEQYKHNEEPVTTERRQAEENNSCNRDVCHQSASDHLNRSSFPKVELCSSIALVKHNYDTLFADDDDDVIIKCTQRIEEAISDSHCKSFDMSSIPVNPYSTSGKPRLVPENEIKSSNRLVTNVSKQSMKYTRGKNNCTAEQPPLHKVTRVKTPASAKYYKDGIFLGYGSRKSPRTKKNIFESLNPVSNEEICNDSFERALQSFVDDGDDAFIDSSADKQLNKNTDLCADTKEKRRSSIVNCTEQSTSAKIKICQNEVKNAASHKSKLSTKERIDTKSKTENPKKCSTLYQGTLLLESRAVSFETLEDDTVNESELLNVLEIVESQSVPSSPPLRCTPEEIQRKRIEAKQKLAKKKLNAKTKTCCPNIVKPKR